MSKLYSFCSLPLRAGLLAACLLAQVLPATGQTTLTTAGTLYDGSNNGGAPGAVTFAVQNANTTGINLTAAASYLYSSDAAATFTLWYHPTQLTGTPGTGGITTANGWIQIASSASPVSVATNGIATVISGMSFTIPANTTYRMAMTSTVTMHYSGTSTNIPSPNSFTSGGVTLLVGNNTVSPGYAGTVTSPSNTPRFFTGSITFASAVPVAPNCVSAPVAPANNSTTVCAGTTQLRWNKVTGATGYDVYLNAGTASPATVVSANQADTFYNATTAVGPYKWRIVPRNAVGPATGCSDFAFTTVASLTPAVTVSVSPNDTLCAGLPATFTATPVNGGTAPAYQWTKNGTNAGTGPSYTDNGLVNHDTIRVVMTSNSGACLSTSNATSAPVIMTILPVPAVTISAAGPINFCEGGMVRLTASTSGAGIQWLSNGQTVAGATGQSYNADISGYYKARVTGANGCTGTSDSIGVTVFSKPFPPVNRNGNVLSTNNTYTSYRWYRNGVLIPGATAYQYTVTRDGAYTVNVVDMAGCSGTSAATPINSLAVGSAISAKDVTVYPNPATGQTLYIQAPEQINAAVHSLDGRQVLQQTGTDRLDIGGLPSGIYQLYISDRSGRLIRVEKLVRTAQ